MARVFLRTFVDVFGIAFALHNLGAYDFGDKVNIGLFVATILTTSIVGRKILTALNIK